MNQRSGESFSARKLAASGRSTASTDSPTSSSTPAMGSRALSVFHREARSSSVVAMRYRKPFLKTALNVELTPRREKSPGSGGVRSPSHVAACFASSRRVLAKSGA